MKEKTNLKANIATSLLYQFVAACSGFILPSFFITQYGSVINGSISTISQITGFLGLLEAGMGSVASVAFYRCLTNEEEFDLTVVCNTVKRHYRIIAAISIAICVILSFVLPVLLNNGLPFSFNFELIIIVSCGYFIQYYLGITPQFLLAADYKSYVISLSQTFTIVANLIVSVVLIQCNTDIRWVKLTSALVMLCRPVILSLYVRKKYRFSNSKAYDSTLLKQRWNNLGQSIAFYIHTQTDMIVIMLFLSVSDNSVYALYMSIISAVKTIITAVVTNYTPIIGRVCANKNTTQVELAESFTRFTLINNFIINVLFSVTAVLIIPFLKIYSKDFDYNYVLPELAIWLCLSEYTYLFRNPYNTLINVQGHFKETQISAFVEAIINIVLSVCLVKALGIIGVAIGTAVAMLYRLLYCIVYVKKHLLNISILELLKPTMLTIISVMCVVVTSILVDLSIVNNYFSFIVAGCLFTFIFAVIQWVFTSLLYKRKRLWAQIFDISNKKN